MSNLYLIERRSLDEMNVDWVALGTEVMKTARKRRGLSYESAARQIPTSSKTYERWEKRGEVPIYHLPKVAEVLDLEIEQKERTRVTVAARNGDSGSGSLGVEERLERLEDLAETILAAVRRQGGERSA